ncbi:MAG: hypothetical protein WA001_03775 [Patescibacteria group bacterium]
MNITVAIDDRELQAKLRSLGPALDRAMAKAINRTAFEVIQEEQQEAIRAFRKATPRGKQLVSGKGSFRFDAATPTKLEAFVRPNENVKRRIEILEEHERGGTITAHSGVPRLAALDKLAVPVGLAAQSRKSRGRVAKRFELETLFGERGRGFIAGRAILERVGVSAKERKAAGQVFGDRTTAAYHGYGKSRSRVLYALVSQAELPDRFRWYEVAREAAAKWFVRKAAEEYGRFSAAAALGQSVPRGSSG